MISSVQKLFSRFSSYNPELVHAEVQNIFLKAVETGLKSSTIVNEVRPLLRQSGVTDEKLITTIRQATQADTDRRLKQTKPAAKNPQCRCRQWHCREHL